jgi:hypothetical protein
MINGQVTAHDVTVLEDVRLEASNKIPNLCHKAGISLNYPLYRISYEEFGI